MRVCSCRGRPRESLGLGSGSILDALKARGQQDRHGRKFRHDRPQTKRLSESRLTDRSLSASGHLPSTKALRRRLLCRRGGKRPSSSGWRSIPPSHSFCGWRDQGCKAGPWRCARSRSLPCSAADGFPAAPGAPAPPRPLATPTDEIKVSTDPGPDSEYTRRWSPTGEPGYATLGDGTRLRYLKARVGRPHLLLLHTRSARSWITSNS